MSEGGLQADRRVNLQMCLLGCWQVRSVLPLLTLLRLTCSGRLALLPRPPQHNLGALPATSIDGIHDALPKLASCPALQTRRCQEAFC